MPQIESPCTSCSAFTRRSLHYEEQYQTSLLLEQLRTTNFPATDEEISHVRHTILPAVSDDISSIESKVESLHEVVRLMEEERERLKDIQKRYNNLISLHRALPLEIWSKIFLCTLPSHYAFTVFDASGPIWKLSHVCQKWRNIALSLYSFWSTIDLRFPKVAQQEGDVQRLETIIQRSRPGPLHVSLKLDDSLGPSSDPSILKHILDIIAAESYRWRKLHLSDYRGSLNMLYALLHHRLPRLECLSLDCVQIESKERSVFKDCPRLTKVILARSLPVVEFPWDQITELSLMDLDVGKEEKRRECMRLIGQCSSLEILATPFWDSENDDGPAYMPITCSNMRKLSATSVPVIDALTVPLLRVASLRPRPKETHYDILSSFKRLLIRSNCLGTLTSLSLTSVPLAASPKHSLHSLLAQTHSLRFFGVYVYMEQNRTDLEDLRQIVAIVKSLEVVPTQSVTFLPRLAALFVRVYNLCDTMAAQYLEPVGSLASVLKARWKGDDTLGLARLRTCRFALQAEYLELTHVFQEEERCIFNALVDDGMDLTIRVTSDNTGNDVVFAVPS